jgi:NAD-dependent SIR2 family protein deacetylase
MSQVFKPSVNTFARISLIVAGLAAVIALSVLFLWDRSPNLTRPIGTAVEQPVRFSHKLHSEQLNISCRYCHEQAEYSSYAGIPDTHTCMSCHSQIATYSELLEPVRTSYATGVPLEWNKVHDLAEHVYFRHQTHVNNGVACETCHGDVNQMQLVWQQETMTMAWCLECHEQPEQYLRPASEIYNFDYEQPENQIELGLQLIEEYDIHTEGLTDCRVCHH